VFEVAIDVCQDKLFFILNAIPHCLSGSIPALTDPHLLLKPKDTSTGKIVSFYSFVTEKCKIT
jgi:hypothetical protein